MERDIMAALVMGVAMLGPLLICGLIIFGLLLETFVYILNCIKKDKGEK